MNYLPYLDSNPSGAFSVTAGEVIPSTWIANARDISGWRLDAYDSSGLFLWTLSAPSGSTAEYREPCVVPVPVSCGGGYLMILARRRQFPGWSTLPATAPVSSRTIGDIVCYWSRTLDFTATTPGDVVGPVLLVDSLSALPDFSYRLWLGVPTGAFVQQRPQSPHDLLVYYAVEHPMPPCLLQEMHPGVMERTAAAAAASDAAPLLTTDTGFIAAKRVPWASLQAAFTRARRGVPGTRESNWTPSAPVDGSLLGRVHLWVPRPYDRFMRAGEEFLSAFSGHVERVTDPEAQVCEDGLSLFFTGLISHTGPLVLDWHNGHGVWRASAIPAGENLKTTDVGGATGIRHTVAGVDFVLVPPRSSGHGPDCVAPAHERGSAPGTAGARSFNARLKASPADADVVQFRRGGVGPALWLVYLGGYDLQPPRGGTPFPLLARVTGTAADGCRDWTFAWTFR